MAQCFNRVPKFSDLPDVLPVFPLSGVLLLPGGMLPLNIFEPRYLNMVADAIATPDRLIGIIQPTAARGPVTPPLHHIGCVGRVTSFQELDDGRYHITLRGLWRFAVGDEVAGTRGYRRVRPVWSEYAGDTTMPDCLNLDRPRLKHLIRAVLGRQADMIDEDVVDRLPDNPLITALCMIAPLDPMDKQALLEAPCCATRAARFMTLLEMAAHGGATGVQ